MYAPIPLFACTLRFVFTLCHTVVPVFDLPLPSLAFILFVYLIGVYKSVFILCNFICVVPSTVDLEEVCPGVPCYVKATAVL